MRNEVRGVLQAGYAGVVDVENARWERMPGGFSGAGIYRIETGDSAYCLRCWPSDGPPESRLLAIHRLIEAASTAGISILPVPVPAASGKTLFETPSPFEPSSAFETPSGSLPDAASTLRTESSSGSGSPGRLWQLENWLPGKADSNPRLSDERLRSAMTMIAQLHLALKSWSPPAAFSDWFQAAREAPSPTILSRLTLIHGYRNSLADFEQAVLDDPHDRFRDLGCRITSMFRIARFAVADELTSCRNLAVTVQPCIRDLRRDHLLFTDDRLTGLVDFGAAAMGSIACDLSRLLGDTAADDTALRKQALEHYEEVRPLKLNESRLLQPLDHSSVLLSGLTWLKRRYVLKNLPADLDAVCDRMEVIVERLARLAEETR